MPNEKYNQGEIQTKSQHLANSIIMELACDISESLTEKECKKRKLRVLIETEDETRYTKKAQDIFNSYYDKQMDEIYALANSIKGVLTYKKLQSKLKK